jgi:hypothetical protein
MSLNPTIGHESQFTAPFDILPNVIYTNPTSLAGSQFVGPFDILPNPSLVPKNPTTGNAGYQFQTPTTLGISQTFDILPNEDLKPKNPTYNNKITIDNKQTQWLPFLTTDIDGAKQASIWKSVLEQTNGTGTNTNQQISNAPVALGGFIGSAIGSISGVPQVSQIFNSVLKKSANDGLVSTYSTLPLNKLYNPFYLGLSDFRTRLATDPGNGAETNIASIISNIRLDGASAASRGSGIAAMYATATAIPGGIYTVFNLNGAGRTGFGWGDHGNQHALRTDFTTRTHVATRWNNATYSAAGNIISGEFVPTINPIERGTPFRGDRVTVIDYGKRSLDNAYLWNPSAIKLPGALGKFLNKANLTQDFIKFFFTGPHLTNNPKSTIEDDIIVFRAIINTLSDSFQPNWTPVQYIGRADSNYQYTGYSRTLDLDFVIVATDRDEMKPIYRKLNALAGYTAPTYLPNSIAMQGPWMRLTIGDLFQQTPVVLTSLTYTLLDTDTTWEINIEQDPEMMQAPHKISVNCGFTVIADTLPQKGGRFYGLAKQYDENSDPVRGNDNWLSDSIDNIDAIPTEPGETRKEKRERLREERQAGKIKTSRGTSTNLGN